MNKNATLREDQLIEYYGESGCERGFPPGHVLNFTTPPFNDFGSTARCGDMTNNTWRCLRTITPEANH